MENRAARFRAVAEDEGLSVEQLRELLDNWKATKGELATPGGSAGARDVLRPTVAPEKGRAENASPPPGAENGGLTLGISIRRGRRPKGAQNSPLGPSVSASRRSRNEVRALPAQADWQPPSVPLPKGLTWPAEQFDRSPEFQKRGGIVCHLERVWRPLIEAGVVDMALMRAFYASTARAVDSFKYNDGKELRTLPSHLDIPLLKVGSGRRRRAGAYGQKSATESLPDENNKKADLTAVRLSAVFFELMRIGDLENPDLPEEERRRRAANLLTTYKRLRKRDPSFHDTGPQLRAARRIQMGNYRRKKKPSPEP